MNILDSISDPLSSDLEIVRQNAERLDVRIWLVGGPVRDALLGRPVRDLDILLEGRLGELAEAVALAVGGRIRDHPDFLTASVLHPEGRSIDFTTARKERYEHPGALPVVEPATVDEDLHRRDFTVNAMAWNIEESRIVDPLSGRGDLDSGLIRILHSKSFTDDPTRIFRAVRFAQRLRFEIETGTATSLERALESGALETISPQRLLRELWTCIGEDEPGPTLVALLERGVLGHWIHPARVDPGLPGRLSAISHLTGSQDELDLEVLYSAAILQGMEVAEPPSLDLSKRRESLLGQLIAGSGERTRLWTHLQTSEERARFCLDHEPEEIVLAASELDDDSRAKEMLDLCRKVRSTRLPFTGADLEVPPGPHIAEALRDARAVASLEDRSPEDLLSFAREAALRYLNSQNDANE